MNVALGLKFHSGTRGNLAVEKSDEHRKNFFSRLIRSFYNHSFLVIADEKEAEKEKLVHWFSWTKRNKTLWGERERERERSTDRQTDRQRAREDTDLNIIFLVSYCSSCMYLFVISFFTTSQKMWDPLGCVWNTLRSSCKNGCWIFWPVFTSLWLVSCCLSLSVFYPASPLTPFTFEFLLTNQSPPTDFRLIHFYF